MLIDTHCHLDAAEFSADRDAQVSLAQALGVSRIIVPAVAERHFSAVRDCCLRYPLCLPAYGIHPLFVAEANAQSLASVRQWLLREMAGAVPPIAIGEIGLDFFVPEADVHAQEQIFVAQLKLARELDLPVLLHVRRAVDSVLKHLRQIGVRKGIAHAFNGSMQQAEAFMRQGFLLGFGGAMTYPRALNLRRLAVALPLEAIVLETDAPDMAPAWRAKERNTPSELASIATMLADLRGISVPVLAQQLHDNVSQLWPHLKSMQA